MVQDVTKPVVPTLADASGECTVTVTAPTTTDNCAGTITGTTSDPLVYNSQDTYVFHCTFNDGNGNTSTANQTVIVHDVTPPVASVLATITGECSATVSAPTTTDNCAGTIKIGRASCRENNSQDIFIVHWTFNDGNGNPSTA